MLNARPSAPLAYRMLALLVLAAIFFWPVR